MERDEIGESGVREIKKRAFLRYENCVDKISMNRFSERIERNLGVSALLLLLYQLVFLGYILYVHRTQIR